MNRIEHVAVLVTLLVCTSACVETDESSPLTPSRDSTSESFFDPEEAFDTKDIAVAVSAKYRVELPKDHSLRELEVDDSSIVEEIGRTPGDEQNGSRFTFRCASEGETRVEFRTVRDGEEDPRTGEVFFECREAMVLFSPPMLGSQPSDLTIDSTFYTVDDRIEVSYSLVDAEGDELRGFDFEPVDSQRSEGVSVSDSTSEGDSERSLALTLEPNTTEATIDVRGQMYSMKKIEPSEVDEVALVSSHGEIVREGALIEDAALFYYLVGMKDGEYVFDLVVSSSGVSGDACSTVEVSDEASLIGFSDSGTCEIDYVDPASGQTRTLSITAQLDD